MTKDGQICNEAHHAIIHDACMEVFVLHITRGFDNSFSDALLMICEVDSLSTKNNTILDPCSNISLITHSAAKLLNLNGRDISVAIIKVRNKTERIKTREYYLTLKDIRGDLWRIRACGMDGITSNIRG